MRYFTLLLLYFASFSSISAQILAHVEKVEGVAEVLQGDSSRWMPIFRGQELGTNIHLKLREGALLVFTLFGSAEKVTLQNQSSLLVKQMQNPAASHWRRQLVLREGSLQILRGGIEKVIPADLYLWKWKWVVPDSGLAAFVVSDTMMQVYVKSGLWIASTASGEHLALGRSQAIEIKAKDGAQRYLSLDTLSENVFASLQEDLLPVFLVAPVQVKDGLVIRSGLGEFIQRAIASGIVGNWRVVIQPNERDRLDVENDEEVGKIAPNFLVNAKIEAFSQFSTKTLSSCSILINFQLINGKTGFVVKEFSHEFEVKREILAVKATDSLVGGFRDDQELLQYLPLDVENSLVQGSIYGDLYGAVQEKAMLFSDPFGF